MLVKDEVTYAPSKKGFIPIAAYLLLPELFLRQELAEV